MSSTKTTLTTFSPHIFSTSNSTTISITGSGWNKSGKTLWFQIRDSTQVATPLGKDKSIIATVSSDTSVTVVVPSGNIIATATNYKLFWGFSNSSEDIPSGTGAWHSNSKIPYIYIFDVNVAGATLPVQGGTNTVVNLFNLPSGITATVTLTPKTVCPTSWSTPNLKPAPIAINGKLKITNASTREGLIHFRAPPLPFEGQYSIDISLALPAASADSNDSKKDPADTSPPASVPGQGLIGYKPILGSMSDITTASVPTMAISCSFSATDPAPTSKLSQLLPNNKDLASWPSWLDDLDQDRTKAGAGDMFAYTGDSDSDGNYKLFIIDGEGHYVLDEAGFSLQLMDLHGSGRFVSGSPVAIRVWAKEKGWRCARMEVNSLTYSAVGNYPRRWIIDAKSKEYPSKPEELFGIYQLVKNPIYKPGDDNANKQSRASPCLIETHNPNQISIGIDKVIIVPGAFSYPIDPYFVSPEIAPVYLLPSARPPQSFIYGDGGYIDGFSVNASMYSVYLTGYIKYVAPTDAMAATVAGPSLNPGESISATCIGSSSLFSSTDSQSKYLLVIASEPSVLARVPNLFYTIYKGDETPATWQPLMSNSLARSVSKGSGQASIVQIPDTNNVLLFQRSKPDIVDVFVCTVDFANKKLTLSNASALEYILTLKSETVMDSVVSAFKTRFGITDVTNVGIVNDSWFSVLYQAQPGSLGSAGYHIFTSPLGFTSTVIHLWYPATTTAPFIAESRGTCLGVYGTMRKYFSPKPLTSATNSSTESTSPNPRLQIITGHLGSKIDLHIDSLTYGGQNIVNVEVKAIKSGNDLKYSIREWSTFRNGSFVASDTYVISSKKQVVTLVTMGEDGKNVDCELMLHWEGTAPGAIDASQVIDGDIWIFEVLPFLVDNISSGVPNTGAGTLVIDTSGSHLPFNASFSCEFSLIYTAPPDKNSYGSVTVVNSKNTGTGNNKNVSGLIIPNGTTVLDGNYQVMLSPNTANIKITIGEKPKTQDQWFISITKGIVSTPISGTVNTGDWGYPDVSGMYSGPSIEVLVSCTNAVKEKIEFIYTVTEVDEGGQKGKQIVTDKAFSLLPVTKKNSAGVERLTGWTYTTFSNGLIFGFDNFSGSPAKRDMWTFNVLPSAPVIEAIGQRPVATFSKSGSNDTAWIIAPTRSAGGRFLQLQIPLSIASEGTSNLPSRAALLPLRSTLEPYIFTDATGPILYFKGVKTPGVSWCKAIKGEVATDSVNEKMYGLAGFLGLDYRAAHSGAIYNVRFPDEGISDTNASGVTAFSTFADNDLISEPKMALKYFKELPPHDWKPDPLSKDAPQYKPTGWLAIFPQYRFHIGQVHVISNLANLLGGSAASVSSTLLGPTMGAAGRQVFDEFFFVNTMVPVNQPAIFQQYQYAVTTEMAAQSQKDWLHDKSGNPVNPFDNSDFYNKVEYNPAWADESDYSKLAKYLMQLSLLRETWECPPVWTISTSEGRTVPAYWRFRIGGPTCDQYRDEAIMSACYRNKYNSIKLSKLPTYFSTDPIFVTKFGTMAAASAYVLTDVRLETSFAQMPIRSKSKLVDALTQSVGSAGMILVTHVAHYLASRGVLNDLTPIPHNQTFDVPVTVSSSDKTRPPENWEITAQSYAGPLMLASQTSGGMLTIWEAAIENKIDLKKLFQSINDAIKRERVIEVPGDRTSLEPRNVSRHVLVGEGEIEEPVPEIVEPSRLIRSAELSLSKEITENLASLRKVMRLKYGSLLLELVLCGSIIAGTAGAWDTNAQEGTLGDAKNVANVITDVIAVAHFGVSFYETVFVRRNMVNRLEATSLDMTQQAEKLINSLKPLEKLSKSLGGLLNVAFGIEFVLSGAQEVSKGGSQKLNGQLDIASGSLMITGGAMEMAGALGAATPIPALGQLIAGIGMEISIIKIWIGGAKSVGGFGQSLLDVIGLGDKGGMSEKDTVTNYIRHVKNCAVLAKVSRQLVTNPQTSPDPRDGGVEAKGSNYIIETFYSVADVNDSF